MSIYEDPKIEYYRLLHLQQINPTGDRWRMIMNFTGRNGINPFEQINSEMRLDLIMRRLQQEFRFRPFTPTTFTLMQHFLRVRMSEAVNRDFFLENLIPLQIFIDRIGSNYSA